MKFGQFSQHVNANNATYATMALLFLVFIFWNLGTFEDYFSTPKSKVSTVANSQSDSDGTAANSSSATNAEQAKKLHEQDIAQRIEDFQASIQELQTKVALTGGNVEELNSNLKALESNEEGRRIGSSIELLENYRSVKELTLKVEEDFKKFSHEYLRFQSDLKSVDNQSLESVLPRLESQHQRLSSTLATIEIAIKIREKNLATIVNDAYSSEISKLTLAENMQNLEAEEEMRVIKASSEERARLRSEKIANAIAAERNRELADIELRQARADEETKKILNDKAALEVKGENERQKALLKAEMERDWPKIEHYLGLMFVKSTRQPTKGGVTEVRESMPVSLAGLKEFGFGKADISASCSALLAFFSYYKTADRGVGPYPIFYGGIPDENGMKAIRPAHDLLEKYGLLLVEEGKLSK